MLTFEGQTCSLGGSPALLMKLACLVRNDRMRPEVANQSDLWSGVLLCSHLHFFLSLQDKRLQQPVCMMICWSWRLVSTKAGSCCPLCFCPATRCHSHYARVVADLPCAGFRVQLILHVRRFFCDHTDCIRKIFTERLPAFVLPWARLTVRLCEALQSVGEASCGELGTRLAERLAIQTSPTTILRRIMVLPTAAVERVSELGIDDFSFRRGRNFGTILVDMQSHQTIDLLPDRKKETAAAWMSAHPEIDEGRVGIAAATMLLRQPVVLPKPSSVRTGSTC